MGPTRSARDDGVAGGGSVRLAATRGDSRRPTARRVIIGLRARPCARPCAVRTFAAPMPGMPGARAPPGASR